MSAKRTLRMSSLSSVLYRDGLDEYTDGTKSADIGSGEVVYKANDGYERYQYRVFVGWFNPEEYAGDEWTIKIAISNHENSDMNWYLLNKKWLDENQINVQKITKNDEMLIKLNFEQWDTYG